MKLTPREVEMVKRIAVSEYHDEPGEWTYSWSVCQTKSWSAVLGSLVKKGYAECDWQTGDDACCRLTPLGVKTYEDLTSPSRGQGESLEE